MDAANEDANDVVFTIVLDPANDFFQPPLEPEMVKVEGRDLGDIIVIEHQI